jgi:hypothetical protein
MRRAGEVVRKLSNRRGAALGMLAPFPLNLMRDAMPLFAFIYRSTRPLTPAELTERSRIVPPWTLAQRDAGRVIAVSVFGEEAAVVPPDDSSQAAQPSALAGCTLVNARDIDDAITLARQFPGRRFGTEVEVKAVKMFLAASVEGET